MAGADAGGAGSRVAGDRGVHHGQAGVAPRVPVARVHRDAGGDACVPAAGHCAGADRAVPLGGGLVRRGGAGDGGQQPGRAAALRAVRVRESQAHVPVLPERRGRVQADPADERAQYSEKCVLE